LVTEEKIAIKRTKVKRKKKERTKVEAKNSNPLRDTNGLYRIASVGRERRSQVIIKSREKATAKLLSLDYRYL
jgi:hypothetical protein